MCVLIFTTNVVWNISQSKKNLQRYGKKCIGFLCKLQVILVWFECNVNFLDPLSYERMICCRVSESYAKQLSALSRYWWWDMGQSFRSHLEEIIHGEKLLWLIQEDKDMKWHDLLA